MIVKTRSALAGTAQEAGGEGWSSARLLVKSDGVGFSLNDTEVAAGASMDLHYSNHIEANYCVAGTGTLTDLETGETYRIAPGTMYCLDKHDRHRLAADESGPLRLICVFTPALSGDETHDADGGYGV